MPIGRSHILNGAEYPGSCIVHKDVEGAESGPNFLKKSGHVFYLRHIGRASEHLAVRRLSQFGGSPLGRDVLAAAERHGRPSPQKLFGDCASDPARPAGHHGILATEKTIRGFHATNLTPHVKVKVVSVPVSERLSNLISEIESVASADIDAAAARSRRSLGEALNQSMRRLRQCQSTEEIAAWLLDSTEPFCARAALFEVTAAGQVKAVAPLEGLEAPLSEAPALAHAIEERDTVASLGSAAEVSAPIAAALDLDPEARIYLFPIVIEDKAVAVLLASASESEPAANAALELLTNAAAGAAQFLSARPEPVIRQAPERLISIEGVDMQPQFRRQALVARARWFARAQVARLRLYHAPALDRGRAERDIYSLLRRQIDAARQAYLQDFLAVSPPIDDYLHRELVSLANGDANLLGPEYPGSLV
jgi:hypothetical protein